MQLDDGVALESIFKNTGVNSADVQVTKMVPIVPSTNDTETYQAFVASIDEKMEELGRYSIESNSAIKIPNSMHLIWELENGAIDERTKIGQPPQIKFKDANGDFIEVGTISEPWQVQVSLKDDGNNSTNLAGNTLINVFNGVANFTDIYVPMRNESAPNQNYQLEFTVASPANNSLGTKESQEFVINARTVTPVVKVLNSDTKIAKGDDIRFKAQLLDVNGNVLQDSNWRGTSWLIETDVSSSSADTLKTFPPTGDAEIEFTYPTSDLVANKWHYHEFMVASYAGDTIIESSRTVIQSDPLLITHSANAAAAYKETQHFSLYYETLNYDTISSVKDLLASEFHNKFHKQSDDFYISEIEILKGSIIVVGTIHATSTEALSVAMDHILEKASEAETLQGLYFDFSTGTCNFKSSSSRESNSDLSDGLCYGQIPLVPGEDNNAAQGLQGWAIALIVVCSVILLTALVFVGIVVHNRNSSQRKHLPEFENIE